MAGDWIKLETATPDKPEILRAARRLNADRDLVFGKLIRMWAWFDKNSVDGRVDGIVSTDIDELVGMPGFADALRHAGWLVYDDAVEFVQMPNFNLHNGESAKKRALKTRRQNNWRAGGVDGFVDGDVDAQASTDASTREEKSIKETPIVPLKPKIDFEPWWALYPRKIGKLKAQTTYERIVKKGTATEAELLDGLRRYIREKPINQDWCHPTTWLNGGRWMDRENAGGGLFASPERPLTPEEQAIKQRLIRERAEARA